MSRRWLEQKVKKRESDKREREREREYEMERRRRKPCPIEQLINKNENETLGNKELHREERDG